MLAIATLSFVSCDKDDDDVDNPIPVTYSISGAASGLQEVPAVITTATGSLSGTFDSTNNKLIYTITWAGLSGNATDAHFHGPAAAGTNGSVLIPLRITTNGISGTATDTLNVADSVKSVFRAAILSGTLYYNIHTTANPDGEIRGQVGTVRN